MSPGLALVSNAPTIDHPASPTIVADALLDAMLACDADCLWIEPALARGAYLLSIERDHHVLASTSLDHALATKIIGRLACIANVDLTAIETTTGVARISDRSRKRDLVFTLGAGVDLRAEIRLVARDAEDLAPASEADLAAGQRVGHYRVLERLGAGGMGSVYRVEHVELGRTCALKILRQSVRDHDPTSAARFAREARAASRVRHPHVVDVFDCGALPDGRPYFVMELLEGRSMRALLDDGALAVPRAIALARQLGAALAATHECGVIHADVSAANLHVQHTDQLKLLDFGLAEVRAPTSAVVVSDVFFGTPCYIAPELVRGFPADERSDQYSFGVLLWEMLVGEPPFDACDPHALCMKHLREEAPAPRSPHGAIPAELIALVGRCMAKAPEVRFPSMRAVCSELAILARTSERTGWRRLLPRRA
jgi:serine/threonine protein kinase